MKFIAPLFIAFAFFYSFDQDLNKQPEVQVLTSGTHTSIRGLSVVNDFIVWASGSNGMVGKTTDGGKTWNWIQVTGFEKSDFRDIEAFDGATAVIMSVAEPAYILKTIDGGKNWKIVYENKTKGMFLDAMEFWNEQAGIVVGDPINGKFFISRTFNGGDTWQDIPIDKRPDADSGEACFAASGTNIRPLDRDEAVFVSGGMKSRLFTKNIPIVLPLIQGEETTGANSVAVWDNKKLNGGKKMIVVGGDFNNPDSTEKVCYYTNDGGKTWTAPVTPPHGYRSCVEYISKNSVVTCGINGVDYSSDAGKNWNWISNESFNVCRVSKMGTAFYLAGNNGTIAQLVWK
ncbi:MAG: oxidoreductase [Bacteroidetes bacterium]|nr:oxidoreductase [Bacteroidota bacterium]MBS1931829.1 oxidoreductase [Bacteroidota bacterium]